MLALRGRSIVRLRVPLLHVASFSSDGAPVKPQFEDILRDIHIENDAKKKPSVHKLTALFRSVTSRQDLIEAAKTLRIYEVNFVDPKQQTAGEFIKAAIKQDAEDLALKTFQQHHRIGMFVSTGSLNNLLVHLYKKKDHASALTLYRELKLYKVEPNVETYSLVLRHLLGANEFAQLLDTLATAGGGGHRRQMSMLTRDYIHKCLYSKEDGYFTSEKREVLHAPKEPMAFHDFWGKREYKAALAKLYQEAWMTPVEVFYPYYSHAIANYMLMSPFTTDKLSIYEIGGGAGTNAKCILDYIQEQAPALYEHTTYTLIEISPRMAARQRERIKDHAGVATVINTDILTYSAQFPAFKDSCYFVAMEVLDNLPHDKVSQDGGEWFETWVDPTTLSEQRRPLEDPLVRQTLDHFPIDLPLREGYKPATRFVRKAMGMADKTLHSAFVPTGAMQLLHTLRTSFPKHHLIAADFDELPAPSLDASSSHPLFHHPRSPTSTASGPLHAANAPLVASKTAGVTCDHDTYLVEGGIADVFFSTDFVKLKHAYCLAQHRQAHQVSIVKSSAFLQQFADTAKTRTILGYNPLLEDYANTSFILS
ncbi:hypothetical protein DYB34_005145 [Aphanomyces astaci]|uniref:type II protein arginine methyltransferase n=3 Tax=Aphanomyces astaci TaxID=112090 RepID=A0A3R6WE92_APHAT|nr:hypothetical protein DYB34_005145 [Aphanomyces astaci]